MNLVLALVWLAAGIAALAYDYLGPGLGLRIIGTNLSIGWLLLVMALYNLARWWSQYSAQTSRQDLHQTRSRYRHVHRPEPEPETGIQADRPSPPAPDTRIRGDQ